MFENNEAYKKTLEKYVPKFPLNPRILNLGCGVCYEGTEIVNHFKGTMLGLDDKEYIINSAKTNNNGSTEFKVINCRDLSSLTESFDIVIQRHPLVSGTWQEVFKQGYNVTKEKGLLFATLFNLNEMLYSKKTLPKIGYKILTCEQNPYATVCGNGLFKIGTDGFVIVAKKEIKKKTLIEKLKEKIRK